MRESPFRSERAIAKALDKSLPSFLIYRQMESPPCLERQSTCMGTTCRLIRKISGVWGARPLRSAPWGRHPLPWRTTKISEADNYLGEEIEENVEKEVIQECMHQLVQLILLSPQSSNPT